MSKPEDEDFRRPQDKPRQKKPATREVFSRFRDVTSSATKPGVTLKKPISTPLAAKTPRAAAFTTPKEVRDASVTAGLATPSIAKGRQAPTSYATPNVRQTPGSSAMKGGGVVGSSQKEPWRASNAESTQTPAQKRAGLVRSVTHTAAGISAAQGGSWTPLRASTDSLPRQSPAIGKKLATPGPGTTPASSIAPSRRMQDRSDPATTQKRGQLRRTVTSTADNGAPPQPLPSVSPTESTKKSANAGPSVYSSSLTTGGRKTQACLASLDAGQRSAAPPLATAQRSVTSSAAHDGSLSQPPTHKKADSSAPKKAGRPNSHEDYALQLAQLLGNSPSIKDDSDLNHLEQHQIADATTCQMNLLRLHVLRVNSLQKKCLEQHDENTVARVEKFQSLQESLCNLKQQNASARYQQILQKYRTSIQDTKHCGTTLQEAAEFLDKEISVPMSPLEQYVLEVKGVQEAFHERSLQLGHLQARCCDGAC